ncbi:MAG: hypothetical protein ACM31C_35215 [Acidobacteriota bacterium]
MSRWWLAVVLALAPAIASAEPTAQQRVAALAVQRAQLVQRFQQETDAIDHLKKEKASWRRDRELRSALAESADTANQLAAVDKQLSQLRAQLGPVKTPKKIVIPDAEIDPLADPEDLDKQAADLKQAEQELARQVQGLDVQAKELAEVADLRKHHERANDLARRDDDQPFRTAQTGGETKGLQNGGGAASPGTNTGGAGAGSGSGAGGGSTGGGGTGTGDTFGTDHGSPGSTQFEAEATIVLGDVLDHATIDGLARASRSGDPAQRADAAKRARDAVKARLELLAKKRAAIEARSKALKQKN